ncbi:effector-associated constant component EACC1 [Streptomyces sp. CA-249302]|uniref:effector-associated constant component EACC1 n=1 Tax=Streptomyces sp. CA-249302 TaxID=3240058 RepID=UPI003D8EF4C5
MTVELRVYVNGVGRLDGLRDWMGGHPGVEVDVVEPPPERNSQGTVWDFLSVVCAAGGPIVAAVSALQLWIGAQTTEIEVEVGGKRFRVNGRNAEVKLREVMEAARALETPAPAEAPDDPA